MSFNGFSFATKAAVCGLLVFAAGACGGESGSTGSTPGKTSEGKALQGTTFRDGTLYFLIDFERREFDLLQGTVPLWTLPFVTSDTDDVADWVEAFQDGLKEGTAPLAENIMLRSKGWLSDSVVAIVAEASGFDPHLLQRQVPARFMLRWDDAALEIVSPIQASGTSLRELWQDARSTARRLFGEEQIKIQVDSSGALTLQRAVRPPILTIVKPPRKR